MTETKYSELQQIIDCGWPKPPFITGEVDQRANRALDFIKEWPIQEAIKVIEQVRVKAEREYREACRANHTGHVTDNEYATSAALQACNYLIKVLSHDQGNITR